MASPSPRSNRNFPSQETPASEKDFSQCRKTASSPEWRDRLKGKLGWNLYRFVLLCFFFFFFLDDASRLGFCFFFLCFWFWNCMDFKVFDLFCVCVCDSRNRETVILKRKNWRGFTLLFNFERKCIIHQSVLSHSCSFYSFFLSIFLSLSTATRKTLLRSFTF